MHFWNTHKIIYEQGNTYIILWLIGTNMRHRNINACLFRALSIKSTEQVKTFKFSFFSIVPNKQRTLVKTKIKNFNFTILFYTKLCNIKLNYYTVQ